MNWRKINAYVDGELPPDEAEALRRLADSDPHLSARIATLSRLKASTRLLRSTPRRTRPALRAARWGLAAAMSLAALAAILMVMPGVTSRAPAEQAFQAWASAAGGNIEPVSIDPLEVPGGVVPDLAPAHLALAYVARPQGAGRIFLGYEGVHGCRIGLMVDRGGVPMQPSGTTRPGAFQTARWTTAQASYEIVSRDMDEARFQAITRAVETLTHDHDQQRLRVAIARDPASLHPCRG